MEIEMDETTTTSDFLNIFINSIQYIAISQAYGGGFHHFKYVLNDGRVIEKLYSKIDARIIRNTLIDNTNYFCIYCDESLVDASYYNEIAFATEEFILKNLELKPVHSGDIYDAQYFNLHFDILGDISDTVLNVVYTPNMVIPFLNFLEKQPKWRGQILLGQYKTCKDVVESQEKRLNACKYELHQVEKEIDKLPPDEKLNIELLK